MRDFLRRRGTLVSHVLTGGRAGVTVCVCGREGEVAEEREMSCQTLNYWCLKDML